MRQKRDAPPDLAQIVAEGRSVNWIRAHYQAGEKTVLRWLREAGIFIPKMHIVHTEIPNDFAEKAGKLFQYELARHYKVSEYAISKWMEELGLEKKRHLPPPPNKRPIPSDLKEVAPTMYKADLCKHYECSRETLNRWLQETGYKAAEYDPAAHKPHVGNIIHKMSFSLTDTRLQTIYNSAADILRRERWVVFPCNADGNYNIGGSYWKVGGRVYTGDELLQKAQKYRRESDVYF